MYTTEIFYFLEKKKKAAEINILVEIVCKKKKENFVFRFNYISKSILHQFTAKFHFTSLAC